MADLIEYDPNVYPAEITYRLVFQQWGFRAEFLSQARGHVRGLNGLTSAIDDLYERLEEEGNSVATILLTDAEGNTCECRDDDGDEADWLVDMLVCAEIVSVTRYSFERAAAAPSNARSDTP